MFVRSGKCIPVVDVAECVADIDKTTMQLIGYKNSSYMLYDDDGYTREYDLEKNCVTLNKNVRCEEQPLVGSREQRGRDKPVVAWLVYNRYHRIFTRKKNMKNVKLIASDNGSHIVDGKWKTPGWHFLTTLTGWMRKESDLL